MQCTIASHQTFDKLRNSEFFVDKTFLIKKFLAGPTRHMLVTAPRGFGKTTNLDMIRRFAEMDIFPNGTMKTDKRIHKNYEIFANVVPRTGNYLKAFLDKKFFNEHFGEYPVIWLDLESKGIKTYDKVDFMRLILNTTIKTEFENHLYLLNSPTICPIDKDLFRKFLYHNCSSEDSIRAYSPRLGIGLLKKLLKTHFQRDSIVFMDNCDAPLKEVILDPKQRTKEALGKLYELSSILEAIPNYDSFAEAEPTNRTFVTGIILPFYRSNTYKHKHGLFKTHILNSYGFTKVEVEALLLNKNLQPKINKMEEWYGGFHESTGSWGGMYNKKQLFNPQTVISYLTSKTNELKAYWNELGSLTTFEPALGPECFGRDVVECFNVCEFEMGYGWPQYGQFSLGMLVEETTNLQRLQTLPILPSQCTERTRYFFMTYMENLGYLSYGDWIDREYRSNSLGYAPTVKRFHRLRIPNLEVRNYIKQTLYNSIVTKTPLNGDIHFRAEFFGAISGVDGSTAGMLRCANALTTLLVATEHRSLEIQVDNAILAHSIRVHLLHPPSQFSVKYMKIPSEEERSRMKSDLDGDLVFTIESKKGLLAFGINIGLREKLETVNQTLSDACFTELASGKPLKAIENATEKIVANLNCDKTSCQFSYLYNDTNLQIENSMKIEKESIQKNAKSKWVL